MPQVNTLAIDIAPSNDFAPTKSGSVSSSEHSGKDFAQVIDQHYQAQKSGKDREEGGNKVKASIDAQPKKNNAYEKASTTSAQSKDKESGTVSNGEVDVETTDNDGEKVLSSDNDITDKAEPLENNKQTNGEQQEAELTSKENIDITVKNKNDITEDFMSFLSASQKILKVDANGESQPIKKKDENLIITDSESKAKTETEAEALLKKVFTGSKSEETTEQKTDNSGKENINKSLIEQFKAKPEMNTAVIVKKGDTETTLPFDVEKNSIAKSSEIEIENDSDSDSPLEKLLGKSKTTEPNLPVNSSNKNVEIISKNTQKETPTSAVVAENSNMLNQLMSSDEIEALVSEGEKAPIVPESKKIKTELVVNQEKKSDKKELDQYDKLVSENVTNIDSEKVNTDKAAFAGVSTSGEKQAHVSNQNNSRVINQTTQKIIDQQASNTGEQSQEQSFAQQDQKQTQSLTDSEKLANSENQVKEKPFSEVFDKKLASTSVENTLNRELRQSNDSAKATAISEEMNTTLASDSAQSTLQSVTSAKQVTLLQNEALSVYRKDFSSAVKDKVMVMMNQKLQQIEIRLDPQELGNVNVKINLQNEQAVVSFTVQNQQAKEAFDQNLGRLKDMLAESGVDVGDANVEQRNKQNDDEQSKGNNNSDEVADRNLSELSDTQTLNLVKGSSSGVDYYA